MKIRIIDRLLCALSGLILLAVAAGAVAETLFRVEVTTALGQYMANHTTANMAVVLAAVAVMALLGIYGVSMLFRRGKGKRGFVLQKTENGELSISIRAIESLVQKCVDKHDELHVAGTTLENSRDGLVIKLRIDLASDVNIPLAVTALQKQIRQYITACSGVDVKEVKVQVETATAKVSHSPYAVPEMLQNPTPLPKMEAETQAEPAAANEKKEEKPLHQRLFGSEEQPAIVPAPPEETEPPVPENEEDKAPAEDTNESEAEAEEESIPEDLSEEEEHEIAE